MMTERWILAAALAAAVAACGGGADALHLPEAMPDEPTRDEALRARLPARSSTPGRPSATIDAESNRKE